MKRAKRRLFRHPEFVLILGPDNPWESLMKPCEYPPGLPLFYGEIGAVDTAIRFITTAHRPATTPAG